MGRAPRCRPHHDPLRHPAPAPDDSRHLGHHHGHLFHDPLRAGRPLHRREGGHAGDPEEPRGPLWHEQAARPSFKYPNRTVNEIIADKLPVSLELGLLSLAVALGVGLPLGVLAAVRRNTWIDYICSSVAMTGSACPTFVLGPLLVLVFAIHLGWFNASGWYGPIDRVLPSLTLGSVYAAYIARLTRGGCSRC
jgi:hypothetical protein